MVGIVWQEVIMFLLLQRC